VASRQSGPGSDWGSQPGSATRRTEPSTVPTDGDQTTRGARSASTPSSAYRYRQPWRPDAPGGPARSADPGRPDEPTRRTPEDPPLRDPGLYALTDHFRERLRQPGRYVSTRTVSAAIRRGQLRWNRTDGWRFAVVEDGIRFVVVVADTETASPVVVTAWTEVADRSVALEAGRFDRVDVDTIAVRAALSESAETRIPEQIRPRTVPRPFVVGGHRLTTDAGDSAVRCTDCGCRFQSKRAITTRGCRGAPQGR